MEMFDYVFPIFFFGVVITGIVIKGLIMAADEAASLTGDQLKIELERPPSVRPAPQIVRSVAIGNDGRNGKTKP